MESGLITLTQYLCCAQTAGSTWLVARTGTELLAILTFFDLFVAHGNLIGDSFGVRGKLQAKKMPEKSFLTINQSFRLF
jgi:hypothetical protein